MKKILALMRKDLELHWKGLAGAWLATVLAFLLLTWIRPIPRLGRGIALLSVFNFQLNILFSDWIIAREKTKGTFALLRAMPLSDWHIVSSKFLFYLLIQSGAFMLSALILVPGLFTVELSATLVMILLVLLSFGSLNICTRWFLSPRLGQGLPFVIAFLFIVLGSLVPDRFPQVFQIILDTWKSGLLKGVMAAASLLWIALFWYLTFRFVASRDTCDLTD